MKEPLTLSNVSGFLLEIQVVYVSTVYQIHPNIICKCNCKEAGIRNRNKGNNIGGDWREQNKENQTDKKYCCTDFSGNQRTGEHFPFLQIYDTEDDLENLFDNK